MRWNTILFDLDGTVTDPKVGITSAAAYALRTLGLGDHDPDTLTPFIGPPLHLIFPRYGAQSDEQIQAAWEFEKYLYSVESMAAWTEGTGYVPPRKDVAEAENGLKDFLAENTMMNAAIEQMDGVVSWTAFPGDAGLEAEQLLLDMRDQILGGQVSAKDGMTSTQDAINQLLDAQ